MTSDFNSSPDTAKPKTAHPKTARRRSREFALQALYAWQIAHGSPREIVEQVRGYEGFERANAELAETLVRGVEMAREIGRQAAFDPFRKRESWPGDDVRDKAALIAKMRDWAETIYHPVGTCRMGGGALDVVDAQLRVHGMRGLRVVDASIMPRIVGGNTNAAVIAIAEKAADLVKVG